jgi:hypothetical protein
MLNPLVVTVNLQLKASDTDSGYEAETNIFPLALP